MAGDDVMFHIKLKVDDSGWEGNGEADAEIVALTSETAVVRVNPNTAWNSDALHRFSVALDVAAQALRRVEPKS